MAAIIGFFVKWIGVFVVTFFVYSLTQALVFSSHVQPGFELGPIYFSWAFIAAMVTFYYGFKLSVS